MEDNELPEVPNLNPLHQLDDASESEHRKRVELARQNSRRKSRRRSSVDNFKLRSHFQMKRSSDVVDIDEWMDDALSTSCMLCGKGFRPNRCNLQCRTGRHHCRYCGILACGECTKFRLHGVRCCSNCKNYGGSVHEIQDKLSMSFSQQRYAFAAQLFWTKQIIVPELGLWQAWDFFILVVIAYSSIMVPLQISLFQLFETPENPSLSTIIIATVDWIVSGILMVDVVLRTRVTYYDKYSHEFCSDQGKVFKMYVKGYFFLDIISAFPFEIFESGYKVLKLLRLVRLPQLIRNVGKRLQNFKLLKQISRSLELFLYFFLLAHVAACLWLWCGLTLDETGRAHLQGWALNAVAGSIYYDPYDLYIKSAYWALATITTVGYGDIVPESNMEHVWACTVMVVGNILSVFILGTLAAGLSDLAEEHSKCSSKLEKVSQHLINCNAPKILRERVLAYYTTQWEVYGSWDQNKAVTDDLPEELKAEISKCRHRNMLRRTPLLLFSEQVDHGNMLSSISKSFKSSLLIPGQAVYSYGDYGTSTVFIRRGLVQRLHFQNHTLLGQPLTAGDYFGDAHIIASEFVQKRLIKERKEECEALGAQKWKLLVRGSSKRMCSMMATSVTEVETISNVQLRRVWGEFSSLYPIMSYIAAQRRFLLITDSDDFKEKFQIDRELLREISGGDYVEVKEDGSGETVSGDDTSTQEIVPGSVITLTVPEPIITAGKKRWSTAKVLIKESEKSLK